MVKGWWLKSEPPDTWLDDLCDATAIYVSHTHSDHLNVHTLKRLFQRNPNASFIVPDFDSQSVFHQIVNMGFKNVTSIPFNQWHELSDECAVMILKDATGREDSSLLVDYLGHKVLNLVDCTRPNNMDLPSDVELLLVAFAGGSTGYPVCWSENYSDDFIEQWMKTDLHAMLDFVEETVRKTQPNVVMPFAGYFVEAHPDDIDIKKKNIKNTWADFDDVIVRCSPQTLRWYPTPGSSLDFADPTTITSPLAPPEHALPNMQYNFAFWDDYFQNMTKEIPLTDENLMSYFKWSGFRGKIILHLVLTDNKFETVIKEWNIDLDSLQFVNSDLKMMSDFEYIRLKVRCDSFCYVMKTGQPWDEMLIGFQARPYRFPDVYNFDFWIHFQDSLPNMPCEFNLDLI
jgi:CMP-N-acetylneuraminate monooxygenase